jgi:hypothetical protein
MFTFALTNMNVMTEIRKRKMSVVRVDDTTSPGTDRICAFCIEEFHYVVSSIQNAQ